MGLKTAIDNPALIDAIIDPILHDARIPGVAFGIVTRNGDAFTKGYGHRDLTQRLAMTAGTIYPIGSTTKAMNATLLGTLVDDGMISWDSPVREYLPHFGLRDPVAGALVTVRDLLIMRTGLPRHDWVWLHNPITREELVQLLRHLEPSAGFRERFQYNNLTVAVAGHIAEVVTGKTWECLIQERLFQPLGMARTQPSLPDSTQITLSYHENRHRELTPTPPRTDGCIAPAGTAVHSTVEDMLRWIVFNLNEGRTGDRVIIQRQTLAQVHAPQVVAGMDMTAPAPDAAYAMGWFVDSYNGCKRLSHGGYLRDVNSDISFFPKEGIGLVTFMNFGPPFPARLINQYVFDALMGFKTVQTIQEKLAQYETRIEESAIRNASVERVSGTSPSHLLDDYVGIYANPGYGSFRIYVANNGLVLHRHTLTLPLQHWHYDSWVAEDHDSFPIQLPHAFDPAKLLRFETNARGRISAVALALESSVTPVRFEKLEDCVAPAAGAAQ